MFDFMHRGQPQADIGVNTVIGLTESGRQLASEDCNSMLISRLAEGNQSVRSLAMDMGVDAHQIILAAERYRRDGLIKAVMGGG